MVPLITRRVCHSRTLPYRLPDLLTRACGCLTLFPWGLDTQEAAVARVDAMDDVIARELGELNNILGENASLKLGTVARPDPACARVPQPLLLIFFLGGALQR